MLLLYIIVMALTVEKGIKDNEKQNRCGLFSQWVLNWPEVWFWFEYPDSTGSWDLVIYVKTCGLRIASPPPPPPPPKKKKKKV